MHLSAFDIIGPVMTGPSSSHTAGAVRLGLLSRRMLEDIPLKATITLHGSFAATGRGHATDRALVAGILGYKPDDKQLPEALLLAETSGVGITFATEDFGQSAHPNSVRIRLSGASGRTVEVTGASIGGGMIEINEIDGFATSFNCDLDTLVCHHIDRNGFLALMTAILAYNGINIATLRTSRQERGDRALTIIETDSPIPAETFNLINQIPQISQVRALVPLK